MDKGHVYLILLDRPLSDLHTARTYIGYSKDLSVRMQQHAHGSRAASRFLQVAYQRGIGWRLLRVWEGDKALERRLKKMKNGPQLASGRQVRGARELSLDEVCNLLCPF